MIPLTLQSVPLYVLGVATGYELSDLEVIADVDPDGNLTEVYIANFQKNHPDAAIVGLTGDAQSDAIWTAVQDILDDKPWLASAYVSDRIDAARELAQERRWKTSTGK